MDDTGESSIGISEIEKPALDFNVSEEFACETELQAEDYYASLFARCDPQNQGLVKVSVLLNTLRELQALVNESENTLDSSFGADSCCTEELQELKKVLDPFRKDPEITLAIFTEGITSYLEKREWSCLSPSKRKSETSIVLTSSPQSHRDVRKLSALLDISNISVTEDTYHPLRKSIENCTDAVKKERNWQEEIADLQLKVEKYHKDNEYLKSRIKDAQDENFNLLRVQRDEMSECNQKDVDLKASANRVKWLEAEIADRKMVILTLEDKVAVLANKNTRLENQCSLYQKERKILLAENEEIKVEVKKTLAAVTVRDELVTRLKSAQATAVKDWEEKEKKLMERNDAVTNTLNQLEEKIIKLELEKSDLENRMNLKMLRSTDKVRPRKKLSFHKVPLDHNQFGESFELDASMDMEDIHTEILAAQEMNSSSPILRSGSPLTSTLSLQLFDVAVQCEQQETVSVATQCSQLEAISVAVQCDNSCGNHSNTEATETVHACQDVVVIAVKKIKYGISIILMFLGAFVLIDSYQSSRNIKSCLNPSYFRSPSSYFAHCGEMIHHEPPVI